MSSDTHHLVAAALKLVRDALDRYIVPCRANFRNAEVDERRPTAAQGEQRKNPDVACDTTELLNRVPMELFIQLCAVEEQQV